MTMFTVILGMLNALRPFYMDVESADARNERMTVIALSIAQATEEATCTGAFAKDGCVPKFKGEPEELAMGLFTIGKFETRYAKHVHEDKCRPWECDTGLAKSLFQVHVSKTTPREVWVRLGGTSQESTLLSARAAAASFSWAWQCGSLDRAFAGYMTSYCQTIKAGKERANDYLANLRRYRRLMKGQQG
ncbi:MAG: hypothetical protein WC565_02100 [Parcubacteria group bacterium]